MYGSHAVAVESAQKFEFTPSGQPFGFIRVGVIIVVHVIRSYIYIYIYIPERRRMALAFSSACRLC